MIIGYRYANEGMRTIKEDKGVDYDVSRTLKDPPPGLEQRWVVGSMIKISKVLEARYQLVTYSLIQVAIGCVQLVAGGIMVIVVILRWNTDERDALICKILRAKLQEFKPAEISNS